MNAFLIRPFGEKNGINFERVQTELLDPALAEAKIPGDTTQKLVYAGNIRTDLFSQLVLPDLVIADAPSNTANVFNELAARHALRDKRTILIRSRSDEVPFDLKTDRYLEYDRDNPGAARPQLVETIRATLASERR